MDINAILQEFQNHPGPKCGMAILSSDARALAEALMPDKRVQHVTISKVVKARFGENVRSEAISRHRLGTCRCFPS